MACLTCCPCKGKGEMIAYPGDRPPYIVDCPRDFRGLDWRYEPVTPETVSAALECCAKDWAAWVVDPALWPCERSY